MGLHNSQKVVVQFEGCTVQKGKTRPLRQQSMVTKMDGGRQKAAALENQDSLFWERTNADSASVRDRCTHFSSERFPCLLIVCFLTKHACRHYPLRFPLGELLVPSVCRKLRTSPVAVGMRALRHLALPACSGLQNFSYLTSILRKRFKVRS